MLSRNLLLQPVEQSGKPHQELSGSGDPPPPSSARGQRSPLVWKQNTRAVVVRPEPTSEGSPPSHFNREECP